MDKIFYTIVIVSIKILAIAYALAPVAIWLCNIYGVIDLSLIQIMILTALSWLLSIISSFVGMSIYRWS